MSRPRQGTAPTPCSLQWLRRRCLTRRARPLRTKKLSNFVCVKAEALLKGWSALTQPPQPLPCSAQRPTRRPSCRALQPGKLLCGLKRQQRVLPADTSLQEICTNLGSVTQFLLPPPLPNLTYYLKTQKYLGNWVDSRFWEQW